MEHATSRQRWDELAALIAAATDADDPRVTSVVVGLERALGLPDLGPTDPGSSVTARRFARVHAAAAARAHRPASTAVAAAIASLLNVEASEPPALGPVSSEAA